MDGPQTWLAVFEAWLAGFQACLAGSKKTKNSTNWKPLVKQGKGTADHLIPLGDWVFHRRHRHHWLYSLSLSSSSFSLELNSFRLGRWCLTVFHDHHVVANETSPNIGVKNCWKMDDSLEMKTSIK